MLDADTYDSEFAKRESVGKKNLLDRKFQEPVIKEEIKMKEQQRMQQLEDDLKQVLVFVWRVSTISIKYGEFKFKFKFKSFIALQPTHSYLSTIIIMT